uniref:Uncharacterized protein n=1 Tax=Heterorhabditis bacteriophora TaxID=37862 RepID=A0A1I7WTY1_HETBA
MIDLVGVGNVTSLQISPVEFFTRELPIAVFVLIFCILFILLYFLVIMVNCTTYTTKSALKLVLICYSSCMCILYIIFNMKIPNKVI